MKKIIALILLSFFFQKTHAQNEKAETDRLVGLSKKLEGTYQLQIINSREKPAFPLSMLDVIEKTRKQNEITYVSLKETVRIMILPLSVIQQPGFVPLPRVAYVEK